VVYIYIYTTAKSVVQVCACESVCVRERVCGVHIYIYTRVQFHEISEATTKEVQDEARAAARAKYTSEASARSRDAGGCTLCVCACIKCVCVCVCVCVFEACNLKWTNLS
jgi:hypothetical protein